MNINYSYFIDTVNTSEIKRIKAKIISVSEDNKSAVIETLDQETRLELYNKSGELLSVGDYVTVEYSDLLSSKTAYIYMRNGIPQFMPPPVTHIYGVSWDGISLTKWARTDDSADFTDPVPYVAGASTYSSPFDNLQPWAGMTVSERTGGTMVKIPKFWYKLSQNGDGMKIQIADKAVDGFNVSPAHMDRGDGKGERDIVYIGRYHCGNDYKSTSGVVPKASITRSAARTGIHNLGATVWQNDFAMRFTVWLLYLVEFADWNSQSKIGKGCGNNSSTQNMGYTDSMPYHTGTTASSRDTYGCGTQYRNIEGLWDNVWDWCDGCYNNSNGFNIILNPANFSDSSGGVSVGIPLSGYPTKFAVKNVSGTYQMFIPTAVNVRNSNYFRDWWDFDASRPCVCVGGYYSQYDDYGLFFLYCREVSYSYRYFGSRLQELP